MREIATTRGATFAQVCPKCGKFVKPYKRIRIKGPNAKCKKCGKVTMPFTGWY